MEGGESKSLVLVSLSVAALLTYARWVSSKLHPGSRRLLALLPAIVILQLLPFSFSTVHLRGFSAFFLGWLALFKLTLLAFNSGPLNPSISLLTFIFIASLPVKLREQNKTKNSSSSTSSSPLISNKVLLYVINSTAFNAVLLAVLALIYRYKESINHYLLILLYCCHIYVTLEIILSGTALLARQLLGIDLEPQFDAPYLSTSLSEFWGRRWNLMVTSILRPSVYVPLRKRCGTEVAILATFFVSGIMHELMIFYIAPLVMPSGEMTCFFFLHGLCVVAEMQARKRWGLTIRPALSVPLAVGFVAVTGAWLFFSTDHKNGDGQESGRRAWNSCPVVRSDRLGHAGSFGLERKPVKE